MSIRCCLLAAGLFVLSGITGTVIPDTSNTGYYWSAAPSQYSPFTWNSMVDFHVNTIDFRYPNYIVDPLIKCPYEGVFPHPYDCTWYYRCHDRYNFTQKYPTLPAMYWRSYYQCEPGTEFLDSLDQCVFKGGADNCKTEPVVCKQRIENCQTKKSCDKSITGSQAVKEVEVCEIASKDCPGKSPVHKCDNESYYDKTNDKCTKKSLIDNCEAGKPQKDFTKQPILCVDAMESCIDVDVCRQGGKRQTERLCELKRKCYGPKKQITERNMCPIDHMFNSLSNVCVTTPSATDACLGTPLRKRPVGPCTKQIENCSIKKACKSKVDTLVCTGVFMCGNNVARRSLCQGPGEVYVPSLGRCSFTDQTSLFRQAVECVRTDTSPKPFINQYVCKKGETTIPWAEGHPDLKCSKRELCRAKLQSKPSKTVTGCDGYFKCMEPGRPVKQMCPGTQFFDYAQMKCIDYKTEYGDNLQYCIESTVTETVVISVDCKTDGDVPEMTGDVKKLNCSKETDCTTFIPITLCENYYKCIKDSNDVVRPVKQQCNKGDSFNPQISKCQKIPDTLCSARQLAMLRNFRASVKSATNVQ